MPISAMMRSMLILAVAPCTVALVNNQNSHFLGAVEGPATFARLLSNNMDNWMQRVLEFKDCHPEGEDDRQCDQSEQDFLKGNGNGNCEFIVDEVMLKKHDGWHTQQFTPDVCEQKILIKTDGADQAWHVAACRSFYAALVSEKSAASLNNRKGGAEAKKVCEKFWTDLVALQKKEHIDKNANDWEKKQDKPWEPYPIESIEAVNAHDASDREHKAEEDKKDEAEDHAKENDEKKEETADQTVHRHSEEKSSAGEKKIEKATNVGQ